jgi:hypothetical protein
MAERWRRCSACKNDIALAAVYWVCSVSTCNRSRTALVFCSVDCWEIHLPTERHREAWAVEKRAPKVADPEPAARPSAAPGRPPAAVPSSPTDVLVVASKLKDYVRQGSGFNTSDRVMLVLSDVLRRLCDTAIANAKRAGRDTVLDRDLPPAS